MVALCGLGGAGKTSVAVEYAYRHLAEVGLAWQFPAEDPTVLTAEFSRLAAQLGVRDLLDARDPVASVHAVLAAFPAAWLLVFDNAPGQGAVQRFLPPAGRGRVLITSQSAVWAPGRAVEVPVLDTEVAAGFLLNRTGDPDLQAAARLQQQGGDGRTDSMDHKQQEQVALHRWAVIAEAASARLTAAERGALVRQIATRAHTHPDGSARRYSRGTAGRWIRAWREAGLDALKPAPRADTGTVRAHPELFAEAAALRLELPSRSAAQIARSCFTVSSAEEPLGQVRMRASASQAEQLVAWAAGWPDRMWAVEGATRAGEPAGRAAAGGGLPAARGNGAFCGCC